MIIFTGFSTDMPTQTFSDKNKILSLEIKLCQWNEIIFARLEFLIIEYSLFSYNFIYDDIIEIRYKIKSKDDNLKVQLRAKKEEEETRGNEIW